MKSTIRKNVNNNQVINSIKIAKEINKMINQNVDEYRQSLINTLLGKPINTTVQKKTIRSKVNAKPKVNSKAGTEIPIKKVLIPSAEISAKIGISRQGIESRCKSWGVKRIKKGGRWYIEKRDVKKLYKRRKK